MRFAFRWTNVVVALLTLASALAVLGSHLLEPGYAEAHHDAAWFVATYAAIQVVMIVAFARDGWLVPWLALLKAACAWVFLLTFTAYAVVQLAMIGALARDGQLVPWLALPKTASAWAFLLTCTVVGRYWIAWTPGRYVYQLFDLDPATNVGLFALAFLGRGAWNTVNAFYFTAPWWRPLRVRRPLLGRVVTAVPVALTAFCVWGFLALVRIESHTFSADAAEVAQFVFGGLECDAFRAHPGEVTTDLRQRGTRQYQVRIAYDCADARVTVVDEDGKLGTAGGPRPECCP